MVSFFTTLLRSRRLLINLIRSDFKNRYLGNHFGIIWAFLQPLVMVLVYWFVFTHGFRSAAVNNVPFLPWLLAGIVPWFLLNDAILSSSRAVVDQVFLVKKIVFEVKMLPLIKIGSAFLVNIVFWLLLLICLIIYHIYPSWLWLEVFYYLFCSLTLAMGLGFLLSAITVFMLDVSQMVTIAMQILFWATPIFWNADLLHGHYQFIIKLNPFSYIVIGMRDALLYHLPFWVHYKTTMYFWLVAIALILLGNLIFNRLRPHFADVL